MDSLTHHNQLPVIDFTNKNLNSDPNSSTSNWQSTRADVLRALENYGCFIAVYDKLTSELDEAIFRASEELFDLPIEAKVLNTSDHVPAHGYIRPQPLAPLYESLGIENVTSLDAVKKFTNTLWPHGNDNFCETAFSYSKIVAELDQTVMRMVAEAYGIEKDYEKLVGSMYYILRLFKYRAPKENEENIGIVPHTDKNFMSILQQHHVKGLEVKTKDGEWLNIALTPSSFIVIAGDVCMAWTNGRIVAPEHRVIMPERTERYSMGQFTFIRDDLMIQVPEELVDDDHPLQFKPFDQYKYLHFYFSDEGRRSKCPIKAFCGV